MTVSLTARQRTWGQLADDPCSKNGTQPSTELGETWGAVDSRMCWQEPCDSPLSFGLDASGNFMLRNSTAGACKQECRLAPTQNDECPRFKIVYHTLHTHNTLHITHQTTIARHARTTQNFKAWSTHHTRRTRMQLQPWLLAKGPCACVIEHSGRIRQNADTTSGSPLKRLLFMKGRCSRITVLKVVVIL